MIVGQVNAKLEPVIRLQILGPTGIARTVETLVDTGFGGFLTMPISEIRVLALRTVGREIGILADGTLQLFDVYEAQVDWDGRRRDIKVQASNSLPLLGTELLLGHDLAIRMMNRGQVTIAAVP